MRTPAIRTGSLSAPVFAKTRNIWKFLGAFASLALVAGCTSTDLVPASKPSETGDLAYFERATFAEFSASWGEDDPTSALAAFNRSCARVMSTRSFSKEARFGRVSDWRPACEAAAGFSDDTTPEELRAFFEAQFVPWRVSSEEAERDGLFTGYFEPILKGARQKSARFSTPLYPRPGDLVLLNLGDFRSKMKGERLAGRVISGRLKPYDSRAKIVSGSLVNKVSPLLYLEDPVDAFFLQIQGSGLIELEDGTQQRLGYDGHNGHIYFAIGRYLVAEGLIPKEKISLQSIREWLGDNPDQADAVMNRNPSYIFFRKVSGDGPIGAQGVALTAGRSLAIDRRFLPLGAPIYVDIDYQDEAGKRLQRLMVTQDTGGAIRGPVRGDVFWGSGKEAEALAGPMAASGRYWLLLPNSVNPTGGS